MRSEKAVSFFTFVKASEVKDVKKYNHAVSVLWSTGTVLFEILGIPLLGTMFWVIGISVAYMRIEARYKK